MMAGDTVFVSRQALEDYRLNPERALTHDGQIAELHEVNKFYTHFQWKAVFDDGFSICVDEAELILAVECPRCEGNGGVIHYMQRFPCGLCNASGLVSQIGRESYIEDNE